MLFSRNMTATVLRYVQAQGSQQPLPPCLSPVPPTPDYPQVTPVCAALPLLKPMVSGCELKKNLCFGLLKKKNSDLVSRGLYLSLAVINPVAFHCWRLHGQLIPALALCAWQPGLGSRLQSSQGHGCAATLAHHACEWSHVSGTLSCPQHSCQSQVGFCPSLAKSLFFR